MLRPAVAGRVGVDALEIVVDAIEDSVQASPREMRALYALMFEALKPIPVLRERMLALHRGFATDLARHVRHGIEAGVVRPDIDPESTARLFLATLRGSAYLWLLDPERFDLAMALEDLRLHVNQTLRVVPESAEASSLR
ncbi:MAG: TetR family transcriptional regulator C-terminal domain-containing protein [Microbacterium sp.]